MPHSCKPRKIVVAYVNVPAWYDHINMLHISLHTSEQYPPPDKNGADQITIVFVGKVRFPQSLGRDTATTATESTNTIAITTTQPRKYLTQGVFFFKKIFKPENKSRSLTASYCCLCPAVHNHVVSPTTSCTNYDGA